MQQYINPGQIDPALVRAQQEYAQKAQAGLSAGYASNQAQDLKVLDALVSSLRRVREEALCAASRLDDFLYRATGDRAAPPPAPTTGANQPVQSPIHEAGDLLNEITAALNSLAGIQSRVDRIA